jgi:Protein of unknown function (DUF732)/Protein of unknown function (DUF2510)
VSAAAPRRWDVCRPARCRRSRLTKRRSCENPALSCPPAGAVSANGEDQSMTTPQPGWYDDPDDSDALRYWDGQVWTLHRQQKPVSRPPSPPQVPPGSLPPPHASPSGAENPPPSSFGPPQRSGTPTAAIAVIGVIAVLAVAGVLVYKFALTHHPSSAPTDSASGAPTNSVPGASTNGGEDQFLSDLARVGITSSTATPETLVARGRTTCSGLAAGNGQDEVATDLVSGSNHFFDGSTAEKIVRYAIKDLCPQQH